VDLPYASLIAISILVIYGCSNSRVPPVVGQVAVKTYRSTELELDWDIFYLPHQEAFSELCKTHDMPELCVSINDQS